MRTVHDNQRILLIRLGGFGDVVFTLPAVQAIRKAFPKAHLSFLVYREFASLLEGFPGVQAVLTLDRVRFRTYNPVALGAETACLIRSMIRGRFQLVVDFQGFGETGLLAWLSGARERWGSVYRPGRRWAYTHPVSRALQRHPIEYHLDVLRGGGLALGAIENQFVVPERTLAEARGFFAQQQLDPGRPTLFIQPFTSTPAKSWPLERYLKLAAHFRSDGLQVLFGGGPAERAALEPARQAGFAVAAGAPALLSAALVKLSTVVLGGDTGLMHLAVALTKRVIMLMGSLYPGACFPFEHADWALLPPAGGSVADISLETVSRACAQALVEPAVVPKPAGSTSFS